MSEALHYLGECVVPMRWGDLDAVGHLNNTCYFRYMEQARVEWLDALGYPIDPDGIGPVLAATSCQYRREMNYPAKVIVTMKVRKVGRSSLVLAHEFRLEGDAVLYAEGKATLVWVDYKLGKSVPIPLAIREQLGPLGQA